MSNTKKFLENILKESDEVPYCDDVNCEPVKEEINLETDYYNYVKGLLELGAIDDPKYVESLNNDDFDALVKSWMKDPEIKKDYEEQQKDLTEADEPEEVPEEQSQEEPVNDFERLSPKIQEALNDVSKNSMYKWVIDDVMDSMIDYDGDSMDEKLKSRLTEIMDHGCQSGTVGSLIYYTDTVKFFDNFNDEIYDMVDNMFGAQSVLEMLQQKCDLTDIIMGADTVKNYLAWMAYETVCSDILDIIESM